MFLEYVSPPTDFYSTSSRVVINSVTYLRCVVLLAAAVGPGRGRPSVLPRRVSMLSSSARPKPPLPIRRTSSVVGTNRAPVNQNNSSIIVNDVSKYSMPALAPPGGHSAPNIVHQTLSSANTSSGTNRTFVSPNSPSIISNDDIIYSMPAVAPPLSLQTTPPSNIRQSLSSTYADVIHSLNHQLGGPEKVVPSNVRWSYHRSTAAVNSGTDNGQNTDGGRIIFVSGNNYRRPATGTSSLMTTQIERGVLLRQNSVPNNRVQPNV